SSTSNLYYCRFLQRQPATTPLEKESNAVTIGDFNNLWQVGRWGVAANLLQVLLKASRRDRDHDPADGFSCIAKGVRAAAPRIGCISGDKRMPFSIYQELELTVD